MTTLRVLRDSTGSSHWGRAFIQGYNDRDVEAMVALAHPDIVGNPSRALGGGTYEGHAGLRNWWNGMAERGSWYDISISGVNLVERRSDDRRGGRDHSAARAQPRGEHRSSERRQVAASKLALFGDVCIDGEPLAPWAAVLILQDSLIIRQRSYLSTRSLLEEIGIVSDDARRR